MKNFICYGCGNQKIPDGTPKNKAFIWTHEETKSKRSYCYDCDDKLLQDQPLPCHTVDKDIYYYDKVIRKNSERT